MIKIYFLLVISFMTFSCKTDNRKSFFLSIEYSSPWTYSTKYTLTQNVLVVKGEDRKNDHQVKDVYRRILTKDESDSIYKILRSISYDTLKDSYENPDFFDGTDKVFKINGEQLASKNVLVYMRSTNVTDIIEQLIQRQVLIDQFKWINYYN